MASIVGKAGEILEVDQHGAAHVGLLGPDGNPIGTLANPLRVTGSLDVAFPAVQAVTGPVEVTNLPAVQTVSGTVEVDNFPAPTADQLVHGRVTVENFPAFPATQQVAGSVSVSNLPADQKVSGTVAVSNPVTSVAVNNLPATQPVSGTVAVSNPVTAVAVNNLPATQTVAGTVGADNRVNGAAVTSANRLPVEASGTVTVANPVSTVAVNNLPATQQVAGTVAVSNQPTATNADLRVGGAAVANGNRVPADVTGTVAVSNPVTAVAVNNLPATQAVSGTVAVNNHPTTAGADLRVGGSAVTSGNRVPVDATGTVAVSNPVTSVAVNNLPTTQQVSGTVNIGNQPATQQVAGTVTVANPVTQVTVGNLPATQAVSGTLGADLRVAGAGASASNPVPTVVVEATDAAAEFTAMVDVAPAAAATDGVTYWSLRNAGSKSIGVRRVDLQQGFSGTSAASRSAYVIQRYSGSAPAGGTTVAPSKKVSASVDTTAAVLMGTAALTVTGVTFGAVVHKVASANQVAATTCQDLVFSGGPLILAPGEGIAVRASGAGLLGSFLVGSIGWYEL